MSRKFKQSRVSLTNKDLLDYTKQAVHKSIAVFMAAAIEEFYWSPEEILRLKERVLKYMNAINDDLITLEDMKRMVADEVGEDFWDMLMGGHHEL